MCSFVFDSSKNTSAHLDFEPGSSSLLMVLKDVGEINSTVLQSENLASITRLTINNAGVTRIAEKAFSSLTNLQYLSLELNNLSQINSNWFKEPAALSEIILTGNHIEVLSESTLGQFANLTSLRLNKNMLRNIEQNSFSSQAALAELDLSKNKLTWVSPQAFRSLTSTKIRLGGNPWDCSCEAEDFVAFMKGLRKVRNYIINVVLLKKRKERKKCKVASPLSSTEQISAGKRDGRDLWESSIPEGSAGVERNGMRDITIKNTVSGPFIHWYSCFFLPNYLFLLKSTSLKA